jgi:hypothetical protein
MKSEIATFYALVSMVLILLRAYPNSLTSRAAFTWFGPAPSEGEVQSHYLFRWCKYALGWFAQLLAVELAGVYCLEVFSQLGESMLYQGVFLFGLPLLGMVALVGAILAGLGALKARVLGPNPQAFVPTSPHGL